MSDAVQYIGTSTVRRIEAEDWASIKVQDQETVEWNKANGWKVSTDDLGPGAMKYLTEMDGDFVVIKQEQEGASDNEAPEQTGPPAEVEAHPDESAPVVVEAPEETSGAKKRTTQK